MGKLSSVPAWAEKQPRSRRSNHPLTGAAYLFRGLALLNRRGVRRYVVAPLLVNVLLFATLLYFAAAQIEPLSDQVERWLPGWLDWLSWLLWPLFMIAALLLIFFGFAILANLIAAPFNGFLAQAIEHSVTGRASAASRRSWVGELIGSISAEGQKLAYFLPRALGLSLLFLVPVVNLIAPFLWVLFCAWMMALQYADYPMANHGIGFTDQRRLMAQELPVGIGFGAMVMLALMVPALNCLVIPGAVAGATLMWLERIHPACATDQGSA